MTKTISIGLIGTGVHGSRYARHLLHDVPGLRLVAVSRRSPEGEIQAREWGVRWHPRWEDLIGDPGVEAVIAVTTPNLNPAIGAAAARAGKPLLIEKPMAADTRSAIAIVDAFAAAGVPLTVAQTQRYNPVILRLREDLPRLGELHAFAAHHRLEPSTHPWLTDPEVAGGGVILHTAVHLFDALRFITKREVRRVRAEIHRRLNPRLEDLLTALVELDGDIHGVVDAGKVGPGRSGRFEFVGSEGQFHGDQIHGTMAFIGGKTREPLPPFPPVSTLVPLLRDWEGFLQGRRKNPIPGEEGVAAVRICEATRLSAEKKREVDLTEIPGID